MRRGKPKLRKAARDHTCLGAPDCVILKGQMHVTVDVFPFTGHWPPYATVERFCVPHTPEEDKHRA